MFAIRVVPVVPGSDFDSALASYAITKEDFEANSPDFTGKLVYIASDENASAENFCETNNEKIEAVSKITVLFFTGRGSEFAFCFREVNAFSVKGGLFVSAEDLFE